MGVSVDMKEHKEQRRGRKRKQNESQRKLKDNMIVEFIIFMLTTHELDLKIGYYFSSLFLLITLLFACNTN